ncbi:MAG: DMT family transporter [Spirochaetia bacterium]|jgi:drug/metabolite transporter (DMT)-like permease|nr:DMT family transporter [Spirochaetia bacterium]
MEKLGALAAFATAVCWSIGPIFFEGASRKVGALAVNFWKVVFAFFLLAATGLIFRGMPFPLDAPLRIWFYLIVSGLIGFVISDFFLFNAYILVGSRVAIVFQSLTPLFTAFFAFFFLGERMLSSQLVGMLVVITGILIVVSSRRKKTGPNQSVKTESTKGYIYSLLASLFQAAGLIFSKIGVKDYDVISSSQIRIMAAIVGLTAQVLILRQGRKIFTELPKERLAFKNIAIGAIFGPFLGVSFSLLAVRYTQAGTASTLMALTPVLIIPPTILILKQKVAIPEFLGAAVAVSGAALFFLL